MKKKSTIMGAAGSRASTEGLKHCTLWKADRSPACRSVLMTLDVLKLSVNEVDVNMDKGEHKCQEMVAMNSLKTLPILKDRDLILTDSHSINSYLATRYGGNDNRVLPQEPGARALVEQHLHFNCGILQPRFKSAANPILYESCQYVLPSNVSEVESAYSDLESILKGKYFGGNELALGDIAILSTVSTLNVIVPIDKTRYPKLLNWLQKISTEMFQVTANAKGLSEFARRLESNRVDDDEKSMFTCPRTSQRRRFLTANSAGVPVVPDTTGQPANFTQNSK